MMTLMREESVSEWVKRGHAVNRWSFHGDTASTNTTLVSAFGMAFWIETGLDRECRLAEMTEMATKQHSRQSSSNVLIVLIRESMDLNDVLGNIKGCRRCCFPRDGTE